MGGIATGVEQAGYNLSALAIRYLLVGLVVILIRGIVTERIYAVMSNAVLWQKKQQVSWRAK